MSRSKKHRFKHEAPSSSVSSSSALMTVCGIHAAKAAIHAAPENITSILVDNKRHDRRIQDLVDAARHYGLKPEFVSREELDNHAQDQIHQGIVVLTKGIKLYNEADIDRLLEATASPALILVLDGVQDPHNLGACLRTAEAAGVNFVVVPKDRAVTLNPTVRKAASGAAERLPFVQVTNLARTLKHLQDAGLWITGTAMDGQALYEVELTGPTVIVMGNEGKGMRRLTREHCDQLISIPMLGEVESLNVSVATGIVLYEVNRQRKQLIQ